MTATNLPGDSRMAGGARVGTWLLRVALAMVFVFFGGLKFATTSMYVRIFATIGLGQWFRYVTGIIEISGAALLLVPRAVVLGEALLGFTMLGAVAFWVVNGNPVAACVPGVLLLAIAGLAWALARPPFGGR